MGPIRDTLQKEENARRQMRERRETVVSAGVCRRLSNSAAETPRRRGGSPQAPGKCAGLPLRQPGLVVPTKTAATTPRRASVHDVRHPPSAPVQTERRSSAPALLEEVGGRSPSPQTTGCRKPSANQRNEAVAGFFQNLLDSPMPHASDFGGFRSSCESSAEKPSLSNEQRSIAWDAFYQRNLNFVEQREEELQRRRVQIQRQEEVECTFEPQITRQYDSFSARLSRLREESQARKEAKLARLRQEQLDREMAECSFHPDRRPKTSNQEPVRAASQERFVGRRLPPQVGNTALGMSPLTPRRLQDHGYASRSLTPRDLTPRSLTPPTLGRCNHSGSSLGYASSGTLASAPSRGACSRHASNAERSLTPRSGGYGARHNARRNAQLGRCGAETRSAQDNAGAMLGKSNGSTPMLHGTRWGSFSSIGARNPLHQALQDDRLHPGPCVAREEDIDPVRRIAEAARQLQHQRSQTVGHSGSGSSLWSIGSSMAGHHFGGSMAANFSGAAAVVPPRADAAQPHDVATGSVPQMQDRSAMEKQVIEREAQTEARRKAAQWAEARRKAAVEIEARRREALEEDFRMSVAREATRQEGIAATPCVPDQNVPASCADDDGPEQAGRDVDREEQQHLSCVRERLVRALAGPLKETQTPRDLSQQPQSRPSRVGAATAAESEAICNPAEKIATGGQHKTGYDVASGCLVCTKDVEQPSMQVNDEVVQDRQPAMSAMPFCASEASVPSVHQGPSCAAAKADACANGANHLDTKAATIVWYPFETDEWCPCMLLPGRTAGGALRVKVRGDVVEVPTERAHLICPPVAGVTCPEDGHAVVPINLAELDRDGLGPEEVELALRTHICGNLPYSHIGTVTLFVNPLRQLNIYGDVWVEKYAALSDSLPPHIYDVAAKAYKRAIDDNQNQAILMVGESGSGKTEGLGHLLHFWSQTAGNEDIDDLVKALLPLMRPFISVPSRCGKASWGSTRALLSVEIGLGTDGFMQRCCAAIDMLEAGRLSRPHDSKGPNFEALHLAAKACSAREWLGNKKDFSILGVLSGVEDVDHSGEALLAWTTALETFGFDVAQILRLLCGFLLLADLQNPDAQENFVDRVQAAAYAWGIAPIALSSALAKDGGEASLPSALEDLYRRFVAWILEVANERMDVSQGSQGLTIAAMEAPSWPEANVGLPSPFEAVQLQLLSESVRAELVAAALVKRGCGGGQTDLGGMAVGFSKRQQAAEAAVDALSGPDGLLTTLESLAQARGGSLGSAEDVAKIRGVAGVVEHTLGENLVASCTRTETPRALLHALETSPVAAVITRSGHDAPSSKIHGARSTVNEVRRKLCGEGGVRPWLIGCMRPNDCGAAARISRSALLRQVKSLMLPEVVQLAAEERYTVVWPLREFRERYASLLHPMPDARCTDIEACELIMEAFGRDEGTVGSEDVFGTQALLRRIDAASARKPRRKTEHCR